MRTINKYIIMKYHKNHMQVQKRKPRKILIKISWFNILMFKSNIIIYTFPGAKYFVQNLFIWYTSYFKRLYYYFFGTVSTYTISYFTKTTSHPRENAFITSICVKKLANNCHYAGASKFWKGSFALENRTPIKLWKR